MQHERHVYDVISYDVIEIEVIQTETKYKRKEGREDGFCRMTGDNKK
jgi:hypothetical protein